MSLCGRPGEQNKQNGRRKASKVSEEMKRGRVKFKTRGAGAKRTREKVGGREKSGGETNYGRNPGKEKKKGGDLERRNHTEKTGKNGPKLKV